MRSRFLEELTTPDLEAYFRAGGDLALLPVGSVEMHGPHQPIGTDTLVARATALIMARDGDGVVLPDVSYTWAGATDGFAGTISIEPELAMRVVEAVLVKAAATGFKRLVVTNIHAPGNSMYHLAVRRVFEKHRIPAMYLNMGGAMSDEARDLFPGEARQAWEASMVLAALHILGKDGLYSQEEMAYDDEAPPSPPQMARFAPAVVGYFMQDPRQHACPSRHVSLERGMRFLELQAKSGLERIALLGPYIEEIEKQANRGTWGE
jgi:creatinine amidohydrolase